MICKTKDGWLILAVWKKIVWHEKIVVKGIDGAGEGGLSYISDRDVQMT